MFFTVHMTDVGNLGFDLIYLRSFGLSRWIAAQYMRCGTYVLVLKHLNDRRNDGVSPSDDDKYAREWEIINNCPCI